MNRKHAPSLSLTQTQPHHQTQPLPLLGRTTTRLSPPDATSLPLLGRTTSLFPRQTGSADALQSGTIPKEIGNITSLKLLNLALT
ncbi:hypothetical protein P8452_42628 [Trifolium repens]|nr:hypothetical protein P8452_42628 [Trifolium repens]